MIARPTWPPRKRRLRGDIDIDGDCDIDLIDWGVLLSLYGTTGDLSLEHAFTWDAENRLTSIQPVSPTSGSKRVEFKYDYRGRRVEKSVTTWNTGVSPADWYAHPTETRRFVWNGWLMLRETIETDGNSDGDLLDGGDSTRTKTYTWGKDLANGGSRGGTGVSPVMRGGTGVSPVMLESAGGIGGLLAVYDDNATTTGGSPSADDLAYVYMYDANGNVGQLCDLSATGGPGVPPGALVATYEYDAYGNATVSSGSYATSNTYRFSTKPWDDETSLGYWGYRYYDPRLGRWMSRDPLEEIGGTQLYLFSGNNSCSIIDAIGLDCLDCMADCIKDNDPIDLAFSAFLSAIPSIVATKDTAAKIARLLGDEELAKGLEYAAMQARLGFGSQYTHLLSVLQAKLAQLGIMKGRILRDVGRTLTWTLGPIDVTYGLLLALVESHCAVVCLYLDKYIHDANIIDSLKEKFFQAPSRPSQHQRCIDDLPWKLRRLSQPRFGGLE